jgi:hypothetical protein
LHSNGYLIDATWYYISLDFVVALTITPPSKKKLKNLAGRFDKKTAFRIRDIPWLTKYYERLFCPPAGTRPLDAKTRTAMYINAF